MIRVLRYVRRPPPNRRAKAIFGAVGRRSLTLLLLLLLIIIIIIIIIIMIMIIMTMNMMTITLILTLKLTIIIIGRRANERAAPWGDRARDSL